MCVIKIETMTELNGYLDYNGLIYKILSVEQLRNFMNELVVEVKGMTKNELSSLCTNPNPTRCPNKEYTDSCGVHYFFDGKKLILWIK